MGGSRGGKLGNSGGFGQIVVEVLRRVVLEVLRRVTLLWVGEQELGGYMR